MNDGAADAMRGGILQGAKSGEFATESSEEAPCRVAAAIVNDDDFMRHIFSGEDIVNITDSADDTTLFIPGGNDDTKQRKRWSIDNW